MLGGMSTPFSDDLDDKVIDITPFKPKRHRKLVILIVAAIVIIVALFRARQTTHVEDITTLKF